MNPLVIITATMIGSLGYLIDGTHGLAMGLFGYSALVVVSEFFNFEGKK